MIDCHSLITYHYQLHTLRCSSCHERFARYNYVLPRAKIDFVHGCYSLITINFIMPRVATNDSHVPSTYSCELELFLHVVCYSLITINWKMPRVAHIRNDLHALRMCSCKLKRVLARGCYSLVTISYQLENATCSSYQEQFACSKYVFPRAKTSFCTWLRLTHPHHYQPHTATCS